MMFRMKGEGRSWKDITAEWSRLTGRQPGSSSLSVRYMKLKEKFSRMGDPDVSLGFPLVSFSTVLALVSGYMALAIVSVCPDTPLFLWPRLGFPLFVSQFTYCQRFSLPPLPLDHYSRTSLLSI